MRLIPLAGPIPPILACGLVPDCVVCVGLTSTGHHLTPGCGHEIAKNCLLEDEVEIRKRRCWTQRPPMKVANVDW